MAKTSSSKRKSREQRRRDRERSRQVESRVIEAGDADESTESQQQNDAAETRGEGAIERREGENDPRPEAYVRPGLMQRLFGGGAKVEDENTGLVHFEQRPGLLRPFARRAYQREAALTSIREGFDNLSDLMTDIRDGLEASVEKQGELLDHLKYLPVVAEQNAEAARRFETQFVEANKLQSEAVKVLREQVRGQNDQQEQLNRLLGAMGKESRDQKRDVDDLQGRLDRMRQSDQAIADNLSTVGTAVRKVSEQGAVHSELAVRMQQAFEERTRQLEESMQRQASRQSLLLMIALLLALVAVAAVAVVGFLWLRQNGAI